MSQVFECRLGPDGTNPGYDAPTPGDPPGILEGTAREMTVNAWDLCLGLWETLTIKPVRELALVLWYGNDHGRMAYRVKPMDVENLVELWTETVVQLSTCHTHAERTEADARTDDLLGPILTAPIAEVRRFAELLADRLEADERVPFLIWSSFRRITLPIVKDRPAGAAIELRKKLAREVAELVDKDLPREDLVEAMVGALQWRPKESLRKVRDRLKAGDRPKIRGRESCLFLSAGGEEVVL